MRDKIAEWLEAIDETALFADGFDGAIIGLTEDSLNNAFRVCYSVDDCCEILMVDHDMGYDEAMEYGGVVSNTMVTMGELRYYCAMERLIEEKGATALEEMRCMI